jgi:spermidine/putrescine transport system permease protein
MAERSFEVARLPGFATIAIAAFVLLYLPIITLVIYSFNASNTITVWGGFSLKWYGDAWANDVVKDATVRSLIIGVSAAVLSTALATMAALGTTRRKAFKGQTLIYVLINQPLMVPEVVTAVALMIFFGLVKVTTGYQGLGYLIAAHTACRSAPGWKAWTSCWKPPPPIFTPAPG